YSAAEFGQSGRSFGPPEEIGEEGENERKEGGLRRYRGSDIARGGVFPIAFSLQQRVILLCQIGYLSSLIRAVDDPARADEIGCPECDVVGELFAGEGAKLHALD